MTDALLTAVATDLFRDLCPPGTVAAAEETGWARELWDGLTTAGFPLVSVPEEAGGSGGDVADACALLRVAGRFTAPVPLAETGLLAGWALSEAGLPQPAGPATVAVGHRGDVVALTGGPGGWRVSGRLYRVPWADAAARVVVHVSRGAEQFVLSLVPPPVERGHNLAGEPRDTITFDDAPVPDDGIAPAPGHVTTAALVLRGALARANLIAGALARVTELTVRYTGEREQFGRPVARFQAVQHHLVRIAEETQAATMAATVAAAAPELFTIASAKIVAGAAASVAAKAAHQAHGAIGMTREYELGQLTRRLWAWRDEFGSEAHWSTRLGTHVSSLGADALWPRITTGLPTLP